MFRDQKNVTRRAHFRKIDPGPAQHPAQFSGKFLAPKFRQRDWPIVILEWRPKIGRLALSELVIKVSEPIPANRRDRKALLQLGKQFSRHSLHPGVARRTAGIRDIDKQIHLLSSSLLEQILEYSRVSRIRKPIPIVKTQPLKRQPP